MIHSRSTPVQATSPEADYRRRLDGWRGRQARLQRRAALLGRVEKVILGIIIALALLAEKETLRTKLVVVGLPALLGQGVSSWRKRSLRGSQHAGRAAEWYEARLMCLTGEWAGGGSTGERFADAAHPCALDLDLFGRGSLFDRVCLARTGAGEEGLAEWLKSPADPEEVRARQAAVAELRDAVESREEMALLEPAGVVDLVALREWLASAPDPGPAWLRPVAFGLVGALLAALVGWLTLGLGPYPLLAILAVEAAVGYRMRDAVRASLAAVSGRSGEIALLVALLARLERGRFRSPWLSRLQAELRGDGLSPSGCVGRLARRVALLDVKKDLPQAPLVSPLLWTTHLAFAIAAWRRRYGPEVARWLGLLGAFEALQSLAGYAYENPADPFPDLLPGGPLFDATALGHPLLPPDRCVPNDVSLDRGLALLIVSGSNMSGKSTLLRAVGLNAVLAQAGAPVRAKRLHLSPLAVGATMRVQDSLHGGTSRFYAELLRVRQIIGMARGPRPLLFLLDELFGGTNSADRRAGAEAVARALVEAGAVGLLTTHDLALTGVADLFGGRARNVHFADHLDGTAVTFDYTMRPGVVPHGNALAILRAAGIAV
ncbi:MAG TPA: hypothetical protein VKA46_28395 [Gemmataceae bacterium]|nr:hypothetical protein [Gemmataceae bacterium]